MPEPFGRRQEGGQSLLPDCDPAPLIDRIDHDQCTCPLRLPGGIEGAKQFVCADIRQSQLIADLTPDFAIDKAPAQHQHCRITMCDMMLCHIRQQVRLAYACLAGHEQAMRVRQLRLMAVYRPGNGMQRFVKLIYVMMPPLNAIPVSGILAVQIPDLSYAITKDRARLIDSLRPEVERYRIGRSHCACPYAQADRTKGSIEPSGGRGGGTICEQFYDIARAAVASRIDSVGQAAKLLDKVGIARESEQSTANRKLYIEFGGVALAERSAGDVEACPEPVRREMQEIKPVAPPAGMAWIGACEMLD